MPDKCVDMVITDPPYNLGKDYGVYKDNLPEEEYCQKMSDVISQCERLSREGMAFYLSTKRTLMFWNLMAKARCIVITKGAISAHDNYYHRQWWSLLITRLPKRRIYDLWTDVRLPGEGYFFKETRYPSPGFTSEKLIRRIFRYFTNEGEIILDPFMGTGTVARVAKDFKCNFIGIEINPEYCKIAEERLAQGVL